ncbi:MAG: FHA domain-containing protein [Desulfobacteraceae bacterium]|nr:FHA domain-containing protein [Desulfobacteraceae bacterium]MBC2756563.1 FHA domain-containing protein [Desulfobacteraceae bacterium]
MTQQTRQLTILFADISNSSNIYELLGNQAAQETVGRILNLLSDLTDKFEGKVIKTVGDAIIATFQSTDNSIEAAKSMQLAMTDEISDNSDLPQINIHIGIHHGSVVIDNEDIFGDAVNVTARVVDYANPRQIVATRAAIENLPRDSSHFTKYITKITAKNISGELELFEIIFEDQNTTMVIDCRKLSDALCSSLYLMRGGQVIVVDVQKPVVSVGREDFNDIAIQYSWISRTHAYIENRNGVFMVKDKSTNGTFIYPQDADPVYINKGEHPIAGKGLIIFGREKESNMDSALTDTIEYDIK